MYVPQTGRAASGPKCAGEPKLTSSVGIVSGSQGVSIHTPSSRTNVFVLTRRNPPQAPRRPRGPHIAPRGSSLGGAQPRPVLRHLHRRGAGYSNELA